MKYSVFELQKTPEGRKFLQKQQKRFELDMLQPSDPRFKKVWGDKVKRDEEMMDQKKRDAADARAAEEEKRKFNLK